MNDLVWDKRMLGAFLALACLSEEEEIVLKDWVLNHHSIVQTSMDHNMSVRKVNKLRRSIRDKYDRVQPYADLPARNIRP